MPSHEDKQKFINGLSKMQLDISVDKYLALLELLQKWNRAKNLTSIKSYSEMIAKHLLDSLSIIPYMSGQHILDVGTGPGFPGLPLAIYFPDKQFTLCDSNGKKTAFILEATRVLNINNVRVINQRIEGLAINDLPPFDCIVSRAFASLPKMIELTNAVLDCTNTYWLAMKGQLHQQELAALDGAYDVETHVLRVPYIEGERHAVIIRNKK